MEQFELIENYLSNEMTAEEKATFESLLQTDTELAKNFALYKAINTEMTATVKNKEADFRTTLKPLQKEYFNTNIIEKTDGGGKVRKMIFAALSAAAILAVVFILVKPGGKTYTTDELYAMHNKHDAVDNTVRGGSLDVDMATATKEYNDKNYTAALPLLNKVKDSSVQAKFMLGVCYLETNDFTKALATFKETYESKSIFADKSSWYIALTHLKNKDIEKCKAQLKTIDNSSSYYKQAKDLLSNL